MAEDLVSAARETTAALVHAARAIQTAPAGHPSRAETFEVLAAKANTFGERWGDLKIEVRPTQLVCQNGVVHHDEDGVLFLASALMAAGVRTLTIGSGVAREELQSLTEILARTGRGDEDPVSALWHAGLWAVTVESEDDIDQQEPTTAAAVVSTIETLEDMRLRARSPGSGLHANPPASRDSIVEAPPPEPALQEEVRAQGAPPSDLWKRTLEITRTALWRADAPVPPELGAKLFREVVRRALEGGDLQLASELLDRADPPEAPAAAVGAAEALVASFGADIVRLVPPLYMQLSQAQGDEVALPLALRAFGHLDGAGVQAAAEIYPETPAQARRPLRRLLSARGGEALDAIVRLADHRSLDVAKDGMGILAVIALPQAHAALRRFIDDPTTPRERLELARAAYEHATGKAAPPPAQAAAPAAAAGSAKSSMAAPLLQSLRDRSRERRLAAARSLAKLGQDTMIFSNIDSLVAHPGFPEADPEEQKALIEALVAAGGQRAKKTLDLVAQRTLGLPVCAVVRAASERIERAAR